LSNTKTDFVIRAIEEAIENLWNLLLSEVELRSPFPTRA